MCLPCTEDLEATPQLFSLGSSRSVSCGVRDRQPIRQVVKGAPKVNEEMWSGVIYYQVKWQSPYFAIFSLPFWINDVSLPTHPPQSREWTPLYETVLSFEAPRTAVLLPCLLLTRQCDSGPPCLQPPTLPGAAVWTGLPGSPPRPGSGKRRWRHLPPLLRYPRASGPARARRGAAARAAWGPRFASESPLCYPHSHCPSDLSRHQLCPRRSGERDGRGRPLLVPAGHRAPRSLREPPGSGVALGSGWGRGPGGRRSPRTAAALGNLHGGPGWSLRPETRVRRLGMRTPGAAPRPDKFLAAWNEGVLKLTLVLISLSFPI